MIDGKNEASLLKECAVKAAGYIQIEISDTGKGIPPGELAHIFNPFFSTKPASGNIRRGMGLYRVRQCIVSHGGAVELRSELGKGTIFTLLLPSAEEDNRCDAVHGNGNLHSSWV
jgi:signal transduction histidine kinase